MKGVMSRGGARRVGALALVLVFTAVAAPNAAGQVVAPADDTARPRPTLPTPPLRPLVRDVLADRMRGPEALTALPRRVLDAVAEQNGKSVAALTEVLTTDSTAWLDRDGRLFHADTPPPANQATAPTPLAARPDDQTFRLHSRPGSERVLYLDFDGYTVGPGSWWKPEGYTALPYDTDGDVTAWSRSEHDAIQYIHQTVAEDYAPFDIDVTTQDPGAAAINRSSITDRAYGGRVVITDSSSIDFCFPCGGLAYVGVIDSIGADHDATQPAWAFSDGGYSPKVLAETASHEFGHTMGLDHDGTRLGGAEYSFGFGMWAPIMGLGYREPVTQWSRGEYPDANNQEDDFAVAASNGVAPVPDDARGGSSATTDLVPGRTQLIGATPAGDVDSWRYVAPCSGPFTFTARVADVNPDLSLELRLSDRAGGFLQGDRVQPVRVSNEVATGMGGSVTHRLSGTSTYTLTVAPLANGTPSTGWSNYANVGRYAIDVAAGCDVNDPRPVLRPGSFGALEGDTGSTTFRIPITLSGPSREVVTVGYGPWPAAGAGLATEGTDYAPVTPGTLTFRPGETVKTVPVTVRGDTVAEPPLWLGEWFFVKFDSPSANARLDTSTFYGLGIGAIVDDD